MCNQKNGLESPKSSTDWSGLNPKESQGSVVKDGLTSLILVLNAANGSLKKIWKYCNYGNKWETSGMRLVLKLTEERKSKSKTDSIAS